MAPPVPDAPRPRWPSTRRGQEPEEHRELRTAVRRLLDRQAPAAPSPETAPGRYDHRLWDVLAGEVGAAGLAVPERLGGAGAGYAECHVVLEELGRAAVASPFLATAVLATQAMLLAPGRGGDVSPSAGSPVAEVLTGIAAGERTATVVWNPATPPQLVATGSVSGGWRVDGVVEHVLDGARADVLLAIARTGDGHGLFLLDAASGGLRRDVVATVDQALHLATVRCSGVHARLLGTPAGGAGVVSRLRDLASTAVSAEQVGGAERCLELTVDHVRTRVQFGRPIGSFQAVKHRLADLLVLVDSARSASLAAAAAWDGDAAEAPALASLAASYCSEAYRAVAAETIQLHGGIGITWEHPAHRYFKRAHSTAVLFGDPAHHRDRLGRRLGYGRAAATDSTS